MSQPILEDVTDHPTSYRVQVVEALANFRSEWQRLAEGKSLIDVEAPIGLVLADIADYLKLQPQERHVVLGGRLIAQVDSFTAKRVEASLPT